MRSRSRRCSSTGACCRGGMLRSPSVHRATSDRRRRWRWWAIRMRRCGSLRWNRLRRNGIGGLETMSKVLCPFLDLPINSPYLGRKFTECEQWRGSVMARLFKEKPQVIVLDMSRRYGADFGFTSYDQAWLGQLDACGQDAARQRAQRFWCWGRLPIRTRRCRRVCRRIWTMRSSARRRGPKAVNDGGIAAEAAATAAGGGQYVELSELFCTAIGAR